MFKVKILYKLIAESEKVYKQIKTLNEKQLRQIDTLFSYLFITQIY